MRPLLFLLFFTLSSAADLETTNVGIEIAAGSLGSFVLTYPEFEPAHKVIEVKVTGQQAKVRYEGGAGWRIGTTSSKAPLWAW